MLRSIVSKIFAVALLVAVPAPSFAAVFVGVSVRIGPPAIPYYAQPPLPRAGLIWTPGYWAWSGSDYFWVPGTWVGAPRVGLLWTPGYWAFRGGYYGWHGGYWGPRVGFYGGVNYGFGYFGAGFVGGGWYHGAYRYNGAYANVNRTVVHNVYVNRTVVNNYTATGAARPSFAGGPGGTKATPSTSELAAAQSPARVSPTSAQVQHEQVAAQNKNQYAAVNDGHPKDAAVAKPFDANNKPADFTPRTDADRAQDRSSAQSGSAAGADASRSNSMSGTNRTNGSDASGAARPDSGDRSGRGDANAGADGANAPAAAGAKHGGHRAGKHAGGGHGGGHQNG